MPDGPFQVTFTQRNRYFLHKPFSIISVQTQLQALFVS
jgi:hypothetical protein